MLDNASHLNVGDVTQVNTRGYNRSGSSTVNVGDGGQFSNKVDIHAGVYQEIRGDDPTLKELYAHIAPAAMHNSAARVDAPKCHEDTRKAVQDDIFSWMSRGTPDEVLWLTGPAGTGKTAIMGTVSDKLEKQGHLAATFYFSSCKGTAETMSKRRFVTTLAYQLAVHPSLQDELSPPILSAVRQNPAIFDMSLKRQLEVLILQPLRASRAHSGSASSSPMVILIDGVDECGEAVYEGSGGSRQDDQVEVLSVLLEMINEPIFPFRIIIASRSETWIRTFFADAGPGVATEIFLDSKYSPDDDIRLFLKSKFAALCRRHGLDPSMWPSEEVIAQLVQDASGQFIYVATVLRFIDTPGTLPQDLLKIVLRAKPQDTRRPFAILDALYTSILMSSQSPYESVLWLKALVLVKRHMAAPSSAWAVDRLFESSPGQARILLLLPSLIHIPNLKAEPDETLQYGVNSSYYGRELSQATGVLIPPQVGWTSSYSFYHKSFPDYLEDHLRCGAAFPDIDDGKVQQWLWGRISRTLKCGGAEVSIDHPGLALTFKRCLLDLLFFFTDCASDWANTLDNDTFAESQPSQWLPVPKTIPSVNGDYDQCVIQACFHFAHKTCRSHRPCGRGCKRWRKAISELPSGDWKNKDWSSLDLFLDRFSIRPLKVNSLLSETF